MSPVIPEVGGPAGPEDGRAASRFGAFAADALRYWEPRRLTYNAVLLLVVVGHYIAAWPASRRGLSRDILLWFFLLAVLANIAYCAAYAVDLFVQFSGLRGAWERRRWAVLLVGTTFAAVLAHFFTLAILGMDTQR